MTIEELNLSQICKLRGEITIGSCFLGDYRNSFGIDTEEVRNFFDNYIMWLGKNYKGTKHLSLSKLDTAANFFEYLKINGYE